MSMPENLHGYHVHIYFDDTTKTRETELHAILVEKFKEQHSRPQFIGIAGPHQSHKCRRSFKGCLHGGCRALAMFNRQGLDILIPAHR